MSQYSTGTVKIGSTAPKIYLYRISNLFLYVSVFKNSILCAKNSFRHVRTAFLVQFIVLLVTLNDLNKRNTHPYVAKVAILRNVRSSIAALIRGYAPEEAYVTLLSINNLREKYLQFHGVFSKIV